MNFKLENKDDVVIFKVLDETIKGKTAAELKAKILIVAQPDVRALIIDLTDVSMMDSSGLGALLLAHRQYKGSEVPVILVGVQDFLQNLLSITRIEELFTYFPTVEEALSELEETN